MELQRLDKFIATQKNITRKEARNLISHGKVKVNGQNIGNADKKIDPKTDKVYLNGEQIGYKKYMYIMLNKPRGVLSATSDKSRKTVVDLVPDGLKRKDLFPVGRLDKDTTGLLIITDDGEFAHRVISPKSGTEKVYVATLDKEILGQHIIAFKNGVTLADGTPCLPAKLERDKQFKNIATVTVLEGKYHQIKRMFGVIGLGVNELHRKSIGGVQLDPTLKEGECRLFTDDEISKIYSKVN